MFEYELLQQSIAFSFQTAREVFVSPHIARGCCTAQVSQLIHRIIKISG